MVQQTNKHNVNEVDIYEPIKIQKQLLITNVILYTVNDRKSTIELSYCYFLYTTLIKQTHFRKMYETLQVKNKMRFLLRRQCSGENESETTRNN